MRARREYAQQARRLAFSTLVTILSHTSAPASDPLFVARRKGMKLSMDYFRHAIEMEDAEKAGKQSTVAV